MFSDNLGRPPDPVTTSSQQSNTNVYFSSSLPPQAKSQVHYPELDIVTVDCSKITNDSGHGHSTAQQGPVPQTGATSCVIDDSGFSSSSIGTALNPDASSCEPLVSALCRGSAAASGMENCWNEVQSVNAGGSGSSISEIEGRWLLGEKREMNFISTQKKNNVTDDLLPLLPFMDDPKLTALPVPARPERQ